MTVGAHHANDVRRVLVPADGPSHRDAQRGVGQRVARRGGVVEHDGRPVEGTSPSALHFRFLWVLDSRPTHSSQRSIRCSARTTCAVCLCCRFRPPPPPLARPRNRGSISHSMPVMLTVPTLAELSGSRFNHHCFACCHHPRVAPQGCVRAAPRARRHRRCRVWDARISPARVELVGPSRHCSRLAGCCCGTRAAVACVQVRE
jgi:hypothetical protein